MTDLGKLKDSLQALGLKPDDRLILAFSAGPDSTALLTMLVELGFSNLSLAYINYHDSPFVGDEESKVVFYARKFKLPLYKKDTDPSAAFGRNFENWAREYRYRFFSELVLEYGAKGVLTAHHRDDHLETYLIQKERHSQVSCFGLRPVSLVMGVKIYRPLLKYSKIELICYLRENQFEFYEDITNSDQTRLRNRIRSRRLSEAEKADLESEIEKKNRALAAVDAEIKTYASDAAIALTDYRSLEEDGRRRLLTYFLAQHFPLRTDKTLNSLVNKAFEFLKRGRVGALYLVDDRYLYLTETTFFVSKFRVRGFYEYRIEKPGQYSFPALEINLNDGRIFNVFSYSYPLTIRPVQKGDVIATKLRTKNVRHFLKSQKVPVFLRELYPVITDRFGQIIYVPFYSDLKSGVIPLKIRLVEYYRD